MWNKPVNSFKFQIPSLNFNVHIFRRVVCDALIHECMQVNIFLQQTSYSCIFKNIFESPTSAESTVSGETVERAGRIPPCPLELSRGGETGRNPVSPQIYGRLRSQIYFSWGMWSSRRVQGRFSWESDFELTCWRHLAIKMFVLIYFHSKGPKTFARTPLTNILNLCTDNPLTEHVEKDIRKDTNNYNFRGKF